MNRKQVIWISDSPSRTTLLPLYSGLVKLDFRILCPQFLTSDQLENVSAVIVSGDRLNQVEDWLRECQERIALMHRSIPLFYLLPLTGKPTPALDLVDDFLALNSTEWEFLKRLELFNAKRELHSQIQRQEQSLINQELTLRQREEFLSVCAHDLRSPLGLIKTSLSVFLNQSNGVLNDEQKELLQRSKRQSEFGLKLVSDLLDVMAFEQGFRPQFQLLDLHQLLSEIRNDFAFQAQEKSIQIHYENAVPHWRVLVDGVRVRQLLQNLLVNALKFSTPKKAIYLTAMPFKGRRKTDPPYPMMIVSVKDQGKGIPEQELQRIFDRFTQLKNSQRADGCGLGLSVAKQISTLHGGNLWVNSIEGQGSTFFVLLPHVVSEVGMLKPIPARLLIAETSHQRRHENFSCLEQKGFELIYSADGVETVALTFHHRPSAVLLTPGLQRMGEADVARLLKSLSETRHIPISIVIPRQSGLSEKYTLPPFDFRLDLPLLLDQIGGAFSPLPQNLQEFQEKVA